VYALPTTHGGFCWLVAETGTGGCEQPRVLGGFAIVEQRGSGGCDRVAVVGVVPDGVRSVEVIANGQRRRARHDSNAFFLELRGAGVSPDTVKAVTFRFESGKEFRLDFAFPPGALSPSG